MDDEKNQDKKNQDKKKQDEKNEEEGRRVRELVERGKHYYGLKEWGESLKYFEEGLKGGGVDIDCHYYMGLIEAQRGEYRRAIEHFEEVIAVEGTGYMKHVYKILSYIYAHQEDYKKAKGLLDELKEKRSYEDKETISILGYIFYKLKDYEEAKEHYKKVLDLDNKNANAYNALGVIHIEEGAIEEGINCCEKALKINPGGAAYLDSIGWGYYKKNDDKRAMKYLKEAFEKEPSNLEIKNHIKEILNLDRN